MKLGVALPLAGDWATPENQSLIAQRAEALGYHSLWVFQRLFYALTPQNDYPPMPGQPWPPGFRRVSDPIVTLAYVAGATTRIRHQRADHRVLHADHARQAAHHAGTGEPRPFSTSAWASAGRAMSTKPRVLHTSGVASAATISSSA